MNRVESWPTTMRCRSGTTETQADERRLLTTQDGRCIARMYAGELGGLVVIGIRELVGVELAIGNRWGCCLCALTGSIREVSLVIGPDGGTIARRGPGSDG